MGESPADVLERECRLLQARIRDLPAARVQGQRAGLRHLVQLFADAAADAEGEPRRDVPPLAAHLLADALAVTSDDLLAATRARRPAVAVPELERVRVALLAEVLLHRYALDGARPGRQASALVVGTLAPGQGADPSPDAALALAARQCPVPPAGFR